jgi:hypothetical protein
MKSKLFGLSFSCEAGQMLGARIAVTVVPLNFVYGFSLWFHILGYQVLVDFLHELHIGVKVLFPFFLGDMYWDYCSAGDFFMGRALRFLQFCW